MRLNHKYNKAFTLIELLVVVAIVMILASLLLPALARGKIIARRMACVSNLRQFGHCIQMYNSDSGDWSYNQSNWAASGNPLISNMGTGGNRLRRERIIRVCPAVAATVDQSLIWTGQIGPSYAMVQPCINDPEAGGAWQPSYKFSYRMIPKPAQFLVMCDFAAGLRVDYRNLPNGTLPIMDRHMGGINVLFGDFHCAYQTLSDVTKQMNYGSLSAYFAAEPPANATIVINYN